MIERTVASIASYVESFDIEESPIMLTAFMLFALLMGSMVVCSTFVALLLPVNINGALSLGAFINVFVWWHFIGRLVGHRRGQR